MIDFRSCGGARLLSHPDRLRPYRLLHMRTYCLTTQTPSLQLCSAVRSVINFQEKEKTYKRLKYLIGASSKPVRLFGKVFTDDEMVVIGIG